jgi:polyisoprenoid-binding protein YceI
MKKAFILSFAFVAVLFTACQNSAPTDAAATTETPAAEPAAATAGALPVNVQNSVIEWVGTKPTGAHNGTIKLQSGELTVTDGNLTAGKFVIDMNSLANTDLPAEKRGDLEGHLKNADFFEVEKHPTGTFEITSVQPLTGDASGATHTVAGNLTLKGIAKPISFPAKLTVAGGKITAETPEFTINRTDWDIKYNSGLIGTVKDKLIDDNVKLKIKLEAGM